MYLYNNPQVDSIINLALSEDIGTGDITTISTIPADKTAHGRFVAKEDMVVCGLDLASYIFSKVDQKISFTPNLKDGDKAVKGDVIAVVDGNARNVLTGERTALNFMQRLSGIATRTAAAVAEVAGTKAKITDTRKTTPNFRAFEKYAVKIGGGALHRFNLSDCAMIKDNHIQVAGSVTNAVKMVKENLSHAHKIELECDNIEQIKEALPLGVDIIMLDNMDLETMKEAVKLIDHRAIVEASGNIRLETVREIAQCGVDIISSSAIVAKAPTLDLALDM